MNYNEKLESLAKEFEATMNHASEVMDEIVATAIEQEVMEAIDELDDFQKLLLLAILEEEMANKQPKQPEPEDDLVELFKSINKELKEKETKKKVVRFDDELLREIEKFFVNK